MLGAGCGIRCLSLTPAQKEIYLLLHGGYSQAEMATLLAVSPSTVADHVKKIYRPLDVHSAHELTGLIRRLARMPAA